MNEICGRSDLLWLGMVFLLGRIVFWLRRYVVAVQKHLFLGVLDGIGQRSSDLVRVVVGFRLFHCNYWVGSG